MRALCGAGGLPHHLPDPRLHWPVVDPFLAPANQRARLVVHAVRLQAQPNAARVQRRGQGHPVGHSGGWASLLWVR
jgi:hypothetical protein